MFLNMKDITLNYITIQGWMVTNLKLSSNDLLVFALVYGFCQDHESEFKGSINYVCDWLNCTRPTASKALNNLCEKGLLIKTQFIVNSVLFNTYKINLEVVKKLYGGSKETLRGGSKETLHNNTIIDNTILDNNNNIHTSFAHLKISFEEFDKLLNLGYSEIEIKNIFEKIENYKKNTIYKSLYLTAKNWLEKEKSFAKKEKESEPIVVGRQTMSTVQQNLDMSGIVNPWLKTD